MKKRILTKSALTTRRLVTCAILSALSVVFLLIGGVTGVLDLSAMVLAAMCIAFVVIEIQVSWAWLVWAVTAVLSLLLVPTKEISLLYLMGGMYPIAKAAFERLHPLFTWLLKLSVFNTVQLFYILAAQKILGLTGEGFDFTAPTLLLGNAAFLVYDFALTVFITFYLVRLRRRIKLPPLK
jgi:hypothetical protein